MIFLDTCILIDYFRKSINISKNEFSNYCINSIVQMELYVGARDKNELIVINRNISAINLVDIDQEILSLATQLINRYSLSKNMTIYDSIIAATCLIYNLPLWTLNKRDFDYIENLELFNE